jgi:hypothetical protein
MTLHRQQISNFIFAAHEAVEDLFANPAIGDHVAHSQQAQMMAHRRLGEVQQSAKFAYVTLAIGEHGEDIQAGFVRQQSKQGRELFQVLIGC